MLLTPLIMGLLVTSIMATNEVILVGLQVNLTVGNGINNAPVVISSYDGTGATYVTGVDNYLTFFIKSASQNVTFNETILDGKLKSDGQWMAVIGTSNNTLYLLNRVAA
jgi:hypothetical protein